MQSSLSGAVELPQVPRNKLVISGYPSLCLDCGERDRPEWESFCGVEMPREIEGLIMSE
jgi:hypothetical protein